jgi:hypothetical protein
MATFYLKLKIKFMLQTKKKYEMQKLLTSTSQIYKEFT